MYTYNCKLVRVIDGDSVVLDVDLGFDIWLKDRNTRLYGIDTPESRTSDSVEKIFGNLAKDRVIELLEGASKIVLTSNEVDKYGRILGNVYVDSQDVSSILIKEKLAVPYFGQSKQEIEQGHLDNRPYLIEKFNLNLS